jgi:REP element-mobilizing transposase RayT
MKNSLSHTVWEYHVVWVPKRRRKIIYGKLRTELRTILQKLNLDVSPKCIETKKHLAAFFKK